MCQRRRKSNTVTSVDIKIGYQAINEVNKTKVIGVIIHEMYISNLSSEISRGIGMIFKAIKRLNKVVLVTLHYSLFTRT